MCQSLWCKKGCSFRPLLSGSRETRMKEPSRESNRATKGSNLIRERPLTTRRNLIRFEFRGAGIQFPTTQRFACRAREFFIPPAKPLEVCFFELLEIE